MNLYMYMLGFLILTSCRSHENVSVEHIISDEIVTITRAPNNKKLDSVCLNVPLEFKLNISSDIKYLSIDNIIDNHYLSTPSDVVIYDKLENKPIFDFKEYLTMNKPFTIIIRERNHLISKNYAIELLKKYNISNSIEHFKLGDTIKLVSYKEFRKENPLFLSDLEKVGDTILITTRKKEEEIYKPKKIKINW
ncbi:hypothetical protein [Flavobacterium sharifuzzamanii]|uniref:hypothetical protein n=1 Tax=Flavobacterium sharifuzzamanii TaxID=2211133 RepID=UPI000DAEE78E|nr:hypothetical protein [Flavobacterium sharifuzzamanii]KAF2082933.1 hypothetical protein DMA14_01040 [Flavobacterium sharifuzzamanii]